MNLREGAEGVRATTEAVVYASITILIKQFFPHPDPNRLSISMIEVSHLKKNFGSQCHPR